MSSEKDSYKQIFRATSVFGGVQVFSIIINLIKSKVIAVFLGTEGMGIYSLLQNPVNLISQISSLGLNSSGIRDVAQSADNKEEFSKTVVTVKSWTRITGLIGALFLFLMAPIISQWTFGNSDYTVDFRFLSLSVFLLAIGYENEIILKGKRRIISVGKAGVLSAACSLIISVPLYYFFRINGIVAVLIITNLLIFLFNHHYASKEEIVSVSLSKREIFDRGKTMAGLGSMMVLSSVVQTLTMYLVNLFIRGYGNMADVGLFQAGMQITNISLELVFTAMAGDYYPRLAAICKDKVKANELVNQQAEVAALISTPILVGMITFCPILIRIFLSSEFLPVQGLICWLLLAASVRSSTWTINYVLLANADMKSFFWLVVMTNSLLICFYPIGYLLFDLKGLGIGYLAMIVINGIVMYVFIHRKYNVVYFKKFTRLLVISILTCLVAFLVFQFTEGWLMYLINTLIFILTSMYCMKELNARIGLLAYIKKRTWRKI